MQDAAKVDADDKEQLLTTYSQEHGEAGPEKQEHWSTPGINGPADFCIGSPTDVVLAERGRGLHARFG